MRPTSHGLLALPNEVLYLILDYLPLLDYINIALSCRLLQALVQTNESKLFIIFINTCNLDEFTLEQLHSLNTKQHSAYLDSYIEYKEDQDKRANSKSGRYFKQSTNSQVIGNFPIIQRLKNGCLNMGDFYAIIFSPTLSKLISAYYSSTFIKVFVKNESIYKFVIKKRLPIWDLLTYTNASRKDIDYFDENNPFDNQLMPLIKRVNITDLLNEAIKDSLPFTLFLLSNPHVFALLQINNLMVAIASYIQRISYNLDNCYLLFSSEERFPYNNLREGWKKLTTDPKVAYVLSKKGPNTFENFHQSYYKNHNIGIKLHPCHQYQDSITVKELDFGLIASTIAELDSAFQKDLQQYPWLAAILGSEFTQFIDSMEDLGLFDDTPVLKNLILTVKELPTLIAKLESIRSRHVAQCPFKDFIKRHRTLLYREPILSNHYDNNLPPYSTIFLSQ